MASALTRVLVTITEFPIEGLKGPNRPGAVVRRENVTITEFPIEGLKGRLRARGQNAGEVTITEFPIEGLKGSEGLQEQHEVVGDNYRIPD